MVDDAAFDGPGNVGALSDTAGTQPSVSLADLRRFSAIAAAGLADAEVTDEACAMSQPLDR